MRIDRNPLEGADNGSKKLQPTWPMDRDDLPELKGTEPKRPFNVNAPELFAGSSPRIRQIDNTGQSTHRDSRSELEENLSSIGQVSVVQHEAVRVRPADIKGLGRDFYPPYRTQSSSSLEMALPILKRAIRPRLMAGKSRVEWTCVRQAH